MEAIKEIFGSVLTIAMVIAMWAISCMIGVVPLIVGLWLWRTIL